jgi:hypothetical protein
VKWWQTAWQVLRDILLTGTGLALIISQIGARDPSSTLIVAGLALTVPAAATHAAGVLTGPSTAPPGESSSLPSPGSRGEPGSRSSSRDGGGGGEGA